MGRSEVRFVVTFTELQQVVDLPESAMKHQAWWANSRRSQAHATAWLDAGFTAHPDFNARTVRFVRGTSAPKRPRGLR